MRNSYWFSVVLHHKIGAGRGGRELGLAGDLDPASGVGGSPIAAAAAAVIRAAERVQFGALDCDVAQAQDLDAEHRRDRGAAVELEPHGSARRQRGGARDR